MSTNNREFDFFALMTSLEAHMLKDPNVRDASPSEALENYFSRKGKRSQRRKNAFRAQRHRRDVMAEKFDTTSKTMVFCARRTRTATQNLKVLTVV